MASQATVSHPRSWRPWTRIRAEVIARDGGVCQLAYPGRCLGVATTADHVLPVCYGGTNDLANLRAVVPSMQRASGPGTMAPTAQRPGLARIVHTGRTMIQSSTTTNEAGEVVVEVWDLDTLVYWRRVDGVTVEERPMTAEEIALYGPPLDAMANEAQLVTESGEAVDKLLLVVDNLNALTDLTNATINANPAAYIKDVAREVKTVARQANREARLTSGSTDSADTGEEL